ncbi:hypothetical protein L2E82_12463 [Cichorium intybus]|uniref:Uncharacterized protein n=1 Tax=Cichorium intybus TaxID=13427 RepID=A0ACB9GH96_CICIN|nr:hypothetical protein L2E82_12463 [Cichorium intybus]
MTQVDLETLASVCGGDRKISCVTLAEEPGDPDIPGSHVMDYPPDCPPESFWLSKDAEFDWFDRNAFLDRKESIKGNSNSMNLNPNLNPGQSNANSSSLQFSSFLKSKPAIISLPKAQKTTYVDTKRRNCKLPSIWLFPKRSDSIGKEPAVVSMAEPSSPKVSCLGRVRSKRCRSRRRSIEPTGEPETPVTQDQKTVQVHKVGFISRMKSLFRSDCLSPRKTNNSPLKINEPSVSSAPKRNNLTCNQVNHERETPADPPSLGRVLQFSSGRRSETWGATEMLT